MNKKVTFLVPIHPPHFHYARDLLASLNRFGLNLQADLWFVFTNEEEQAAFGEYEHTIILPEDLRIFDNRGIINIKKFYGLRQIQQQYEYIIVLDAESLFIKQVDLLSVCNEYFGNKVLLGSEVLPEGVARTDGIKASCKKYFEWHKDFEKLNNPLYLWFNQPCIYKTAMLDDFWNRFNYDAHIKKLQWVDFDYYIYMFYLMLFQGFRIEDIEIKSNYGICEVDDDFLFFKSDKYESLPILMASQPVLHRFDNPKCFIAIHLDRSKDWLIRVMSQKIDWCQQQIRELKKQNNNKTTTNFFRRLLACLYLQNRSVAECGEMDDDISFVIQGELNAETTPRAIKSIHRFFPGAEIVLGTYIGSDTTGLDYDKIALVEYPGFYPYGDQPDSKPNNINRQIQTTLAGLKAATRKYAFKLRSDLILTGRGFLDFWGKFPKSDTAHRIFEKKILSCVFFARDPRAENPLSFHPSDIAFFGLRTDLINLFDVPFMTEKDSTYYKLHGRKYCRYVPEQHLWIECLRKNGKKIDFDHQRDFGRNIADETEKYAVSNFIYLDWTQFCLKPPEHLTRFANNDFASCITHVEWQKLYKEYLDAAHELPVRDEMRELIDRKSKIFKRYKILAKIITLAFPTKFLKKFRKNLRKKMIQRWEKNLCLPT